MRMLKLIGVGLLASLAVPASAADVPYPVRPIRVIIPTAPGGGSDAMVRMLGQKFTDAWGVSRSWSITV
jgi:tripartite-type tricarboxylate transporter receptor subunit TctC